MAGGPSTTALVAAAAEAGALGFVPGGYKSARAMRESIDEVEAASAGKFGVNVFMPGEPAADRAALARYLDAIAGDAAAVGSAPGPPTWDDDAFPAKIADLVGGPVPVVSFTLGCPPPAVIGALRAAGSSVWVTVTDEDEVGVAAAAGAD